MGDECIEGIEEMGSAGLDKQVRANMLMGKMVNGLQVVIRL